VLGDDALAPDSIVTRESIRRDEIAGENRQLAPTDGAPEYDQ
jgi:hypothetical protein